VFDSRWDQILLLFPADFNSEITSHQRSSFSFPETFNDSEVHQTFFCSYMSTFKQGASDRGLTRPVFGADNPPQAPCPSPRS
jgi:hypothetical protein